MNSSIPHAPSNHSIRALVPSDAARIFEIISSSKLNSQVPIGPEWTLAQVTEECAHCGWVQVDPSGRVVAFVLMTDVGAAIEISFLATDPNARGRGLMRGLMNHVKTQRPIDKPIWLEVHAENAPARQLYEMVGFIEVGIRPKYYADGGSAILYSCD